MDVCINYQLAAAVPAPVGMIKTTTSLPHLCSALKTKYQLDKIALRASPVPPGFVCHFINKDHAVAGILSGMTRGFRIG